MKTTIFSFTSSRHILLFVFLIASPMLLAQAPTIAWKKCYGSTANETCRSIQQTSDGGYIGVGWTYGEPDNQVTFNHGSYDYWVIKTNSTGVLQWQKSLGGTNLDWGMCIRQTPDGGYLVLGDSRSSDGDLTLHYGVAVESDLWVVKLNAIGNIMWQKTLGGSGDDHAKKLELTTDGGFIIVGDSRSNDHDVSQNHNGSIDVWVAKLDAVGTLQWQRSLGGNAADRGYDVKPTPDGGYIVAAAAESINNGDITDNHGNSDIWLIKLSETGSTQWQKIYGGSSSEIVGELKLTSDGGYVIAGASSSINWDVSGHIGSQDIWIFKTDSNGVILWQRVLGGTLLDSAYALSTTTDGGYIITGYTASSDGDITGYNSNGDIWVAKLSASGTLQWQKALGGDAADGGFSIVQSSDGGYLVAGTVTSTQTNEIPGYFGHGDFWLIKFSGDNLAVNQFSETSALVYPNPSSSFLKLQLPQNERAEKVEITDTTGKIITQQMDYNSEISIEGLSAGVYVIKITGKDKTYLSKFIKK